MGAKCRRNNSCNCMRISVLLCSVGFSFELIQTQHISNLPCDNCVGYQLCYFVTRYSELRISLLSLVMLAFAGATDQMGILAKSTDSKKIYFQENLPLITKVLEFYTFRKKFCVVHSCLYLVLSLVYKVRDSHGYLANSLQVIVARLCFDWSFQ